MTLQCRSICALPVGRSVGRSEGTLSKCIVNSGGELELADIPQCLCFFRKKKLEEEEAEVKRKATDAAYQGKLSLVLLLALTTWFCVLMTGGCVVRGACRLLHCRDLAVDGFLIYSLLVCVYL